MTREERHRWLVKRDAEIWRAVRAGKNVRAVAVRVGLCKITVDAIVRRVDRAVRTLKADRSSCEL